MYIDCKTDDYQTPTTNQSISPSQTPIIETTAASKDPTDHPTISPLIHNSTILVKDITTKDGEVNKLNESTVHEMTMEQLIRIWVQLN